MSRISVGSLSNKHGVTWKSADLALHTTIIAVEDSDGVIVGYGWFTKRSADRLSEKDYLLMEKGMGLRGSRSRSHSMKMVLI